MIDVILTNYTRPNNIRPILERLHEMPNRGTVCLIDNADRPENRVDHLGGIVDLYYTVDKQKPNKWGPSSRWLVMEKSPALDGCL